MFEKQLHKNQRVLCHLFRIQEIVTKFISKTEQVGQWSKETKQILSALKKKR